MSLKTWNNMFHLRHMSEAPGLPLQPTKDETNRLKADPSRLPFGVKFIVQRYGRVVKLGNQTLII